QPHGSIYDVVAAKVGFQKPIGEWNVEEITAQGRHIKVVLNGTAITDANLNEVSNPEILQRHPGLFRERGHIGFLGHNDYVEYRNLRVKELPVSHSDNSPPAGFVALFNGKDLTGWKGLVATPPKRAKMSAAELAAAQKKEDENMRSHWKVTDGVLVFDGQGRNLCSAKDFADFELTAEWKIEPKGDSGIYLRGCPQVQIWDYTDTRGKKDHSVGSGGLHNNLKNPSAPFQRADHSIGQWNHFRILMMDDKVHVFLNDQLVVTNTTLENSWERDKPVYPAGPIELQNHQNPLYFKNIYVRELHPKTN
ncbi:MAG: 3-keto-disaccharide hydrolase, partial [Limisphaerales bacterium]